MLRCAVLDDYQKAAMAHADWAALDGQVEVTCFHEYLAPEALPAALAGFDIIVAMRERTRFDAALLEALPKLRLLVTTGMANASIDMAAAKKHGITVCGTKSLGNHTPELTWGLLLALARHIPAEHDHVRGGGWQESVGADLAGATLGIIGLGRIGKVIARYAAAFDMKILAWSPNLTAERCAEAGAELAPSLDALMAASDFVSIHMALAPTTRHLVNAEAIRAMKPGGYLVNTSRGPLVDNAALLAALHEGRIGGAALDVYDIEPLPADHPFRSAPRLIATPHIGYVTAKNYAVFYSEAVEDIAGWLAGNPVRVLAAPEMPR